MVLCLSWLVQNTSGFISVPDGPMRTDIFHIFLGILDARTATTVTLKKTQFFLQDNR